MKEKDMSILKLGLFKKIWHSYKNKQVDKTENANTQSELIYEKGGI